MTERKHFMQYVKEYWFLATFAFGMAFTMWQGFDALAARAEEASRTAESNTKTLAELRAAMQQSASKFLTDIEFDRLWKELEDQSESVDDLEARFNQLQLSDERLGAKIELESEKLRREIQQSNQEQTKVLNEILREIKN